ncbi:MAG: hypothetical protein JO272_04905 [Pseudonocardiales bacterium]|nr:hypothetical protein [Pseudonocardiales bacterium]
MKQGQGRYVALCWGSIPARVEVYPVGLTDSPALVIVRRLLDELRLRGFEFRRAALGVDGPLAGNRTSGNSVRRRVAQVARVVGALAVVAGQAVIFRLLLVQGGMCLIAGGCRS